MESTKDRRTAAGWAWGVAALVLATAGTLYGNGRIHEAWHFCLTQDHEPDPNLATAMLSVWAVMLVALLMLGSVLACLPQSRWYLWPAMIAVAVALTCLYVTGMGYPAPLQPGDPPEAACRTMLTFPFTG